MAYNYYIFNHDRWNLLGFFTPTEGAAVGAAGTGIIAALNKKFSLLSFLDVIQSTAITTGMIFLVLLGAEFSNSFIALSQLPNVLAELTLKHQLTPMIVIASILILYVLLGCLMLDSLAMILLTIPVFFPRNVVRFLECLWKKPLYGLAY